MVTESIVPERLVNCDAASLLLDPENPRLPEELIGKSQGELLRWLFAEEVLDELARSMLENGFFEHEPLIVLPPDSEGKRIVVEGNRRLAALTTILQLATAKEAEIEFDLSSPATGPQLDRLRTVPCFVVASRDEVRKFLGFRHIGGLKTWSPEAKARYLEAEVGRAIADGSQSPFRDVARRVGSTVPAVRGQYVALQVLRAARDYGVETNFVMRERFGVWNRLLNSPEARSYIGLGDAATVDEVQSACTTLRPAELKQVISDLTPPQSGGRSVLWDSRDATIYGKVLADDRARASLAKFGDLSIARQIVERGALAERLLTIGRSIDAMTQDIDSYDLDGETEAAASGVESSARTLRSAIRDRREDAHD